MSASAPSGADRRLGMLVMQDDKLDNAPNSDDLEWARTFIETLLAPGPQAEAGIRILARLFAAKRALGRLEPPQ
jgi:hypothetical protein